MALELIPLDRHWALEIEAEGSASLAASCSNFENVQEFLDDAVDAHIALYRRTDARAPWIAYLGRVRETREIVGICSFKDQCRDGRVEIAYYTFAPYRRRGFGTSMAGQLVALALRHPDVREVVAHTEPLESASTRILRGLDFAHEGHVFDPEDGEVWRWVRLRERRGDRRERAAAVPMMRASAVLALFARDPQALRQVKP